MFMDFLNKYLKKYVYMCVCMYVCIRERGEEGEWEGEKQWRERETLIGYTLTGNGTCNLSLCGTCPTDWTTLVMAIYWYFRERGRQTLISCLPYVPRKHTAMFAEIAHAFVIWYGPMAAWVGVALGDILLIWYDSELHQLLVTKQSPSNVPVSFNS